MLDRNLEKAFSFSERHLDLMRRDQQSVFGWRYEPRVIFSGGKGVKLFDVDGNEYYDMSSGMMCLVLGHGHPELTETIREQAEFIHQSSWYTNPWAIEFAELIGSTLPGDLKVVNFAVTGSEANEIAMRMALGATGAFEICSVMRGLHGGSLAAEAVTTVGGARKRGLGPLTIPARATTILPPFYYRAPVRDDEEAWDRISLQLSDELIEFTTSQEIAGIIIEPMMVAGGMIVPSQRWMRGLRDIADRWGAVLIFDEAQLAPGRTGKMWGFEHYDVMPEIVTFAKGMTAGFAVCGTVTTPEIAEKVRGKKGLPWAGTYPQDPLPCAVALKQLQIVLRDNLVERAGQLGEEMRKGLEGLKDRYECIGDVRGKGLYQMIDVVADRDSRKADPEMAERIRHFALLEGVVLIAVKNYIRFCPPSIITEAQLDDVMGRLDAAVRRAQDGTPVKTNYSGSSSLAASDAVRKIA